MARITQSMLTSRYLLNNNRNLYNMRTLQNQLSSGKLINRASDNPYKATRIMQLYTEIDANKQFKENVKNTSSWLDATDSALGEIDNILARVRELQVKTGNGTYKDDELQAIQLEIQQKIKQLQQVLNTNFDGNFIFGGTKSTSKPLIIDENGGLQYADKDGNQIKIYKDLKTGKYTTTAIASGTSVSLGSTGRLTTSNLESMAGTEIDPDAVPAANYSSMLKQLEAELKNEDTSESRKAEIQLIIGTRENVYERTYNNTLSTTGTITLKSTMDTAWTGNVGADITKVGKVQSDLEKYKENLQAEYDDESVPETRKSELKTMLSNISTSQNISKEIEDLMVQRASSTSASEIAQINSLINSKTAMLTGYTSGMYLKNSSGPYYSTDSSAGTATNCTVTEYSSTDVALKTAVERELGNVTNPPSEKRAAELKNILEAITPKIDTVYLQEYSDGSKKITSSNLNQPVSEISDSDYNTLKSEYTALVDSTTSLTTQQQARKSELEKMLILKGQIDGKLQVEVSEGAMFEYNTTACDVLNYKSSDGTVKSAIDILNDIVNNLGKQGEIIKNSDGTSSVADASKVHGELLTEMDAIIKNLLSERSKAGALYNRIEATEERNEADNESMVNILSKTEDADYAEKMIEFTTMQTIYQASLQVSSRILQNTLLDYM